MGPKNTVIYTKQNCPFCTKIKQLYTMKGWSYQEMVLDVNFTRDQIYEEFGRGCTFPQVIVDGRRTGGCNETINEFRRNGWV